MPKKTTQAAVSWEALPEAEVVDFATSTRTPRDAETTTPEPIKVRVTTARQATASTGRACYFVQACGSPAAAEEFMRLARAYARSKGWTLRGRVASDDHLKELIKHSRVPVKTPAGSVVIYTVKDRETRRRLSSEDIGAMVAMLRKEPVVQAIAAHFGVSVPTVRKVAKEHGIVLPDGRRRS